MKKKALIVDDSKLARFVLKEMLREYGLHADTSESAEEALGYLCTQRPDVIFMDHTMPGMDGLKAVEAIKNDPQTAAIPIMMYTSKEGAMYVSQARALGAVGVLPKQLKSVQLGKVLQQLGLVAAEERPVPTAPPSPRSERRPDGRERIPQQTASPPRPAKPETAAPVKAAESVAGTEMAAAATAGGPESKLDLLENLAHEAEHSAEISWLRPLLRELLEEQRQQIRADLRRVLAPGVVAGDGDEGDSNPLPVYPPPVRAANTWALPAFILAVPLALFAYVLNGNTQVIADLQAQNQRLQSLTPLQESRPAAVIQQPRVTATATTAVEADLLQVIAWANNRRNIVPFTDVPLGDTALELLSRLVPVLNAAQVPGTLVLITHTAEFCVVEGPGGELALAADSLPFTECTLNEQNLGESIEFSNYLASVRAGAGPSLRVRIENRGNLEPLVPYPLPESLANAGQWNRVAQANNRIEIAFEGQSKGIAFN
ncbi:response regulator [Exilibacterium tricleocarpae]|uniref:Response regulator n=1 Tax=Exilibacterium tricleocarpae TaxID=2591008 RepID=A0A545SPV0_9GAMM|nr:response regulator [Exilibacterium tricleocarpae]TQV67003.1 response regulator [Exilibacterium tricleocarpae]